jgi:hypothetical protein
MSLSLKKPSHERSEERAKAAAEKLGEGEKRIVADVPEHVHRQVRMKCLERGVLVRDYILELLAKDGLAQCCDWQTRQSLPSQGGVRSTHRPSLPGAKRHD